RRRRRRRAPSPHDLAAGFPLGKHGCCVLLTQQFWLIPPLMSTHCPAGVMLTQAEPVQVVSQVPQPAALSSVWPGHGRGPARTEFPVESGRPALLSPPRAPPPPRPPHT